ncbi:MAG: hypothetical protein Q9183_005565 [Haloplaca sp. 2 TL-2023]
MVSKQAEADPNTNEQAPLSTKVPETAADSTKTTSQSTTDALATAKMEKIPEEVLWVSQELRLFNHYPAPKARYSRLSPYESNHTRDDAEMKRHGEQCAALAGMVKDMNDRLEAYAETSHGSKGEGQSPGERGAVDTYHELRGELGMWSKLLEENARQVKWGGWDMAEKLLEAKLGIPDELGWWQIDVG